MTGAPIRLVPAQPGAPRRPVLPFDVLESKLRTPVLRAGLVSRTALVNRLRAASEPVVSVTAPAGYGKTTLLAQWAERDRRPFAWISLDRRDDEPLVLLRHVAAALHAISPVEPRALDALADPAPSIWTAIVPRLGAAMRDAPEPIVVVLDGAHLLGSPDALEAVDALVGHLSPGSALAFAARSAPRMPLASLRAAGMLHEVGARQLALSPREAQLLLRGTGLSPTLEEATELTRECEGWPAALYLSARGDRDRTLGEYFHAEYLTRLSPRARRFLRRSAVLDELSGSLCDHVLDLQGSAAELRKIERAELFLVPLDRTEAWYRYHRLFRRALLRELTEEEPDLAPVLHRRAADWYEEHGKLEQALVHADAAGDVRRVTRILAGIALPLYHGGRVDTVERWLARLDDATLLARHPSLALQGSWIHASRGRAADARRWLAIAEDGIAQHKPSSRDTLHRAWGSVIRATLGGDGVYRMIEDSESALAQLPRENLARPAALVALGAGYLLLGQGERADATFAEAAAEAERLGASDTQVVAVGERALIALKRGDFDAAETLAAEAQSLAARHDLGAYASTTLALAASARTSLRHGLSSRARDDLERIRELDGDAVPWRAVQTRIELARAFLALRETQTVHELLAEIDELLLHNPNLGVLADEARELDAEVAALEPQGESAAGLTAAELRLLPYLATHLSFREIGEELFVSRNTIKTQAISVYRKLGVTSRSEAIASASRLGLVEAELP